jgi:ssDNA-binding Zn-finger/Zn-ribbon topoisomerase 1
MKKDINQIAKSIVDRATGQVDEDSSDKKDTKICPECRGKKFLRIPRPDDVELIRCEKCKGEGVVEETIWERENENNENI